jgi:hypothetical protein
MAESRKHIPVKLPSLAFIMCLMISFAIWTVITMAKDYKMSYEYKLVCDHLPEGRHSVTVSDTVIILTFNQKGIRYLTKPFTEKDKVVTVSVNDLIKPKNKVSVYTFTNKEMCDFLSTHNFGSELVAVSSPEVITFYLR